MAAMRGATHQKMQSFDFNNVSQYGPAGQQFIYPNQTNLSGGRADGFFCNDGVLSNFMTPSPDSPGQWSSGSPQSHSDWSEGILSPPASGMNQYQQQQMAQQQMLQQQQTDSVLI
jgi:Notch-like protein